MMKAIHFAAKGLLVSMLSVAIVISGCSFASAINELKQWTPTVLTAVGGVIQIINPPAGSAILLADTALQKLLGAGGAVPNAIAAYQTAPGNGTALSNLTAALNAMNSQFDAMLIAVQANPNSQDAKDAELGLTLLIATLEQFQTRLAPQPPATQTAHAARAHTLGITPAKNRADFVKKWNTLLPAHPLS